MSNKFPHKGVEYVHISKIRVGDVIEHEGFWRTICASNIGGDSFIGKTLFGDSYKSGHTLVQRAIT